jgi:NMD protein affecting ribosome stability and mRNA decay
MKTQKPNTFTKRKSIDTASDPYLLSEGNNGKSVCKKCHAVYHNKRWYMDEALYEKRVAQKSINKVLCPACRKVKDRFPGGILRLKGKFLKEHKSEIMNLIRNEEQKARGFNPLERIMGISSIKAGLEVTTTNEKLAQRIGKSLHKAYQGKIEYKWSSDTKLLRAEWER